MSPLRARACSLLLSCAALGVTAAQAQTTYYVDQNHPAARDTNPGSASAPWRSIQQAAQVLEPGDTVLVASGVYTELYTGYPNSALGAIKPQRSGTVEAPITYAAAPGASVVIDQQGAGPGFYISTTALMYSGFALALTLLVLAMLRLETYFATPGSMHDLQFFEEGRPNLGTKGGEETFNAQYLLQLTQVLKYEMWHDSALARFLLRRALRAESPVWLQ